MTTRTERIEAALRKLTVMARTSGGVAGRDEGLCAACDEAEHALAQPAEAEARAGGRRPDMKDVLVELRQMAADFIEQIDGAEETRGHDSHLTFQADVCQTAASEIATLRERLAEAERERDLAREQLLAPIHKALTGMADAGIDPEAVEKANRRTRAAEAQLAAIKPWQCFECGSEADEPGVKACSVCGALDLGPRATAERTGTDYVELVKEKEAAEADRDRLRAALRQTEILLWEDMISEAHEHIKVTLEGTDAKTRGEVFGHLPSVVAPGLTAALSATPAAPDPRDAVVAAAREVVRVCLWVRAEDCPEGKSGGPGNDLASALAALDGGGAPVLRSPKGVVG